MSISGDSDLGLFAALGYMRSMPDKKLYIVEFWLRECDEFQDYKDLIDPNSERTPGSVDGEFLILETILPEHFIQIVEAAPPGRYDHRY